MVAGDIEDDDDDDEELLEAELEDDEPFDGPGELEQAESKKAEAARIQ